MVFNPDNNERAFKKATELRSEYVIAVEGEVEKRPEGNINPDIPTGEIEIRGNRLRILDESETPSL